MIRAILGTAAVASSASAAILLRDQCCFQLTASGGRSGIVGQLSDGQNRIGGGYPSGSYCLNSGGITDSNGRGCILTPPTSQFQCDVGASPTPGFSVTGSGILQYSGNPKFFACEAAPGDFNIYTAPSGTNCVEITLNTGGKCGVSTSSASSPHSSLGYPAPSTNSVPYVSVTQPVPSQPSMSPYSQTYQKSSASHPSYSQPSYQPGPSAPPYSYSSSPCPSVTYGTQPTTKKTVTSTVTSIYRTPIQSTPYQSPPVSYPPPSSSQPASSASGSACQTSLSAGAYQTPHLIVPISSSQPDTSFGTQYNATINSDKCTIFNFDIPQTYAGKSCSTIFLFPQQSQLVTSSYSFSGSGTLVFSELSNPASGQTTWNSSPGKKNELGSVSIQPGNSYAIATQSCPAGTTQSIEVCGTNGLSLEYFQDWNPSPIGVFITSC